MVPAAEAIEPFVTPWAPLLAGGRRGWWGRGIQWGSRGGGAGARDQGNCSNLMQHIHSRNYVWFIFSKKCFFHGSNLSV